MLGLGRNKGNYPYATARVKAKKSNLLTQDNYPKLLMMDEPSMGLAPILVQEVFLPALGHCGPGDAQQRSPT